MRLKTDANTYLAIKDEYGKIRNQMILVVSKTVNWKGGGGFKYYKLGGYN